MCVGSSAGGWVFSFPPGPPCGPIYSNERVERLLREVQPEIQTLKEKLNTVSPACFLTPVSPHQPSETGFMVNIKPPVDPGTVPTVPGLFTQTFSWQVSMWVQLHVPKIEDGNNFGVAVQVGDYRRSTGGRRVWNIKLSSCPTGESVWAAD